MESGEGPGSGEGRAQATSQTRARTRTPSRRPPRPRRRPLQRRAHQRRERPCHWRTTRTPRSLRRRGILAGRRWARATGITLAALSLVAQFLFLPYAPFRSVVVMALDLFVIWALAVYHGGRVR
ncbi:DUF7144 family membrane protein [Streptomyces buecherae]|uniref:DUF7144 family membrane protein n=1 Tax=Streptomyces buecherae TaxID=2763006 RepID=UPI0021C2FD91|nr:hypothetical protein [Streptomyces buecherae]